MEAEKGPLDHYGSDLKERKPSESFLVKFLLRVFSKNTSLTESLGEMDVW